MKLSDFRCFRLRVFVFVSISLRCARLARRAFAGFRNLGSASFHSGTFFDMNEFAKLILFE